MSGRQGAAEGAARAAGSEVYVEGFGPEKLIFLLLIMLLVFGAKRLPEIGSSLGKGIREFKKSVRVDDEPMQATSFPAAPAPASLPAPQGVQPAPVQRIETTQA